MVNVTAFRSTVGAASLSVERGSRPSSMLSTRPSAHLLRLVPQSQLPQVPGSGAGAGAVVSPKEKVPIQLSRNRQRAEAARMHQEGRAWGKSPLCSAAAGRWCTGPCRALLAQHNRATPRARPPAPVTKAASRRVGNPARVVATGPEPAKMRAAAMQHTSPDDLFKIVR
jgi:hypothetical protein